MASVCVIGGKSGTGKSTSGRNLDPKITFWINADKKDLPFKGWAGKFNKDAGNYAKTSSPVQILNVLKAIPEKAPHIKYVVIDTINRVMTDKVMRDRNVKGFDKWSELAGGIYDIIQYSNESLPEDMVLFLLCHTEEGFTDMGAQYKKVQTSGKQLDKIVIESMSTIVLFTNIKHSEGKNEYFFETQTDGISTAKSPEGMFESFLIPNDLNEVAEAIINYKH